MDDVGEKSGEKILDKDITRRLFRWGYEVISVAVLLLEILGVEFKVTYGIIFILCVVYAVFSVYFLKNNIDFRDDSEQDWGVYRAQLKLIIALCAVFVVYTLVKLMI